MAAVQRAGRAADVVRAWRPAVPGIAEVFHARFTSHAYPPHTHDTWTVLIVDEGAVRYDLDRVERGAATSMVTVLPPHVPHDGRSASAGGFRKRVLYLDSGVLGDELIGAAVKSPALGDPRLRGLIDALHRVLPDPGDALEAESRLAFIQERLRFHLAPGSAPEAAGRPDRLAGRLRDLLEARIHDGVTLGEAARLLQAHPTHLVREFSRAYGLPPHAYLTARRVATARRLLLAGQPPVAVATAAGFYDQAHLTRVFARHVGVTPARYAAGRLSSALV
jgi:AraC-like DNA-binding protein